VKAIILSAGRGSRLGEHTANRPKCLLPLGSRTLLGWQIEGLARVGVRDVVVVTGSLNETVATEVATYAGGPSRVRTLFNPFFAVSDNLASCWMARNEMDGPFILINGDTVFEPTVAGKLLAAPVAPITLAVDRKLSYDSDDMKVAVSNGRLVDVSKRMDPAAVWGESIGMIRFESDGARAFAAQLDAMIQTNTGLKSFYLVAIAELARRLHVGVAQITGSRWCEIDFPKDLAAATALCAVWDTENAAAG